MNAWKYIFNINLYRLALGLLYLCITLQDLYKAIFVLPPLYVEQGIDLSCVDGLAYNQLMLTCVMLVYLSLLALYLWKFRTSRFLMWYFRIIDVIVALFIGKFIYDYLSPIEIVMQ